MKIAMLTSFLIFALPAIGPTQNLLTLTDSLQLPQASIWGGISFNGENISVTTTLHQPTPHLYIRKLDTTLNQLGDIIPLTTDSDEVTVKHITDHKHLFLNGHHFVTFSVAGDSDLYIFKVDRDGRRVGNIVPVVEGTENRTNDMMFCSDGENLFVAYFKPVSQSVVHTLDQNLNQAAPPLVTSAQMPHNNLGGMVFYDNKFYMFSGDKAGPNSHLILTIWNRDWTPALSSPQILIPAPQGEGLYFATGISYDESRQRWYIGFHHIKNSNPEATHIDLAVFDANFGLLEWQHGPEGNRPHFLLLEDHLYMIYDRAGVFIYKYRVNSSTQVDSKDATLLPERIYLDQNYPNPFNPSTTIRFSLSQRSSVVLKVFDVRGNHVATLVDGELGPGVHSVVFDASGLASGFYFPRLSAGGLNLTKKVVLIK